MIPCTTTSPIFVMVCPTPSPAYYPRQLDSTPRLKIDLLLDSRRELVYFRQAKLAGGRKWKAGDAGQHCMWPDPKLIRYSANHPPVCFEKFTDELG